jgi:hypothetical protein
MNRNDDTGRNITIWTGCRLPCTVFVLLSASYSLSELREALAANDLAISAHSCDPPVGMFCSLTNCSFLWRHRTKGIAGGSTCCTVPSARGAIPFEKVRGKVRATTAKANEKQKKHKTESGRNGALVLLVLHCYCCFIDN